MRSLLLVLAAVLVASPEIHAQEQTAAPPAADLSKPFAPTLGDMIAFSMSNYLTLIRLTDTPNIGQPSIPYALAAYDRNDKDIGIMFFGTASSVDAAKATIESFRARYMPGLAGIVAETYRVTLDADALVLIYMDRNKGREIVRRESGRYIVGE